MTNLFNRYFLSEDGKIFDTKRKKFLSVKKYIYLEIEPGKYRQFLYNNLYYNTFSKVKLKKGQSAILVGDELSLENFQIVESNSRRLWIDLSKEEVVSMYKDGCTLREIAYKFHTNPPIIREILKEVGIRATAKNCFRTSYTVNHDYFKEISSHDKAYLLGILFADGCVDLKSNAITLISNDKDLLNFFKDKVEFSGNIKKNPCHDKSEYVVFSSIQMKKDLIQLGCTPKKSLKLKFPKINDKFFWSFLLGYFDGDGSLWISKNGNAAHFKIISSTSFCEKLQLLLKDKGLKSEVRTESRYKAETSYLRITSKKTIKIIEELLYKNTSFFLKRKRDKFGEIKTKERD